MPLRPRQEEGIVLAPNCQKGWLVLAEVLLKHRVKRDVALIVAEEIELDLTGAGAGQIEIVERISVRRHSGRVGYTVSVLPNRRLGGEEGAEHVPIGLRGIPPICADRIPPIAQTLLIGVAFLRNDGQKCALDGEQPIESRWAHRSRRRKSRSGRARLLL